MSVCSTMHGRVSGSVESAGSQRVVLQGPIMFAEFSEGIVNAHASGIRVVGFKRLRFRCRGLRLSFLLTQRLHYLGSLFA